MGRQGAPLLQTLPHGRRHGLQAVERIGSPDVRRHFVDQQIELGPAVPQDLAAYQVEGLYAVGAFIKLGDAAIAHQLLHAPLADVAVTAVQLHPKTGDFLTDVGEERLDDRDQQRRPPSCRLARRCTFRSMLQVQLPSGVDAQHATALGKGLLGQQHAPHVWMDDNRIGRLFRCHRPGKRARLQTLPGIGQPSLKSGLGNTKPLQADLEAGIVHHGEHAGQALVGLPHQPALGTVEIHHAGRSTLDAHLVLQRPAAQRIALATGQQLGHQEQADAPDTGRRIRQAREYQMNDVVGQVLLATTDEYLAAGNAVAAVRFRLGAGTQQRQVGAGLRLGQAHGAGPLATDHPAQVSLLECLAAMAMQRQDRALGQAGVDAERQRRRHQHFMEAGRCHLRQTLATIGLRPGHTGPAMFDVLPIGVPHAVRGGDLAAHPLAALFVTVAIEWCDDLASETCGLFKDAVEGVAVQFDT